MKEDCKDVFSTFEFDRELAKMLLWLGRNFWSALAAVSIFIGQVSFPEWGVNNFFNTLRNCSSFSNLGQSKTGIGIGIRQQRFLVLFSSLRYYSKRLLILSIGFLWIIYGEITLIISPKFKMRWFLCDSIAQYPCLPWNALLWCKRTVLGFALEHGICFDILPCNKKNER